MLNYHVIHMLVSLLCIGLTAQSELETDEVVPRLLYRQEAHLSSDHPVRTLRRRGRRYLDAPREGHADPENIILSLPAFGSNLYLNLTRDSTFLSRDFFVEERHRDQSTVVRRLSKIQLCFYSGAIINHTDSLASVSTCGGLTGFVQIGEDSLFIQPVSVNDPSQSFSGLKHQLLRHRRSAKTNSALDAEQPNYCGIVQAFTTGGLWVQVLVDSCGSRDLHESHRLTGFPQSACRLPDPCLPVPVVGLGSCIGPPIMPCGHGNLPDYSGCGAKE